MWAGEFRARRRGAQGPGFAKVGVVLVIVAPGQGAQSPGFLTPWLEDPVFASRFRWLSTVAGLDLAHYGTEADAETIRDTRIAQPLLVATGLIAALELFPHPADAFSQIGAVAGHSVGELAAAAGARAITAEQAMVLVRERGKAMAEAAATTATGMTAVLGGDPDEVLAAIEAQGLVPANNNGPGQVVAAGTMEQLQAFAEQPPAKARLVPLSVAGAFHTEHMAPAVGHLATLARSVSTHDPRTPFISNRDGQVVHDGREIMKRIVGQIAQPVRWDLCLETMSDLGVTGLLEMPPAGTLTGIAKRALPGVETFALKTPDQLDDARAFCAKHGEASIIDSTPTWLMVISPAKGTFHRAEAAADSAVLEPGAALGDVASLRDRTEVKAPHGGTVVEWLVEDGDLVSPGQPLVRLHPVGAA
jgi:[acyl-carrier-protein] S-malonyltransferase